MKNLRNIQRTAIDFVVQNLSATAWDVDNSRVLCTFGPSEHDPNVQLCRIAVDSSQSHTHSSTTVASWQTLAPHPDSPCDKVISLHYFPDSASCCVIFEGGDITVVREKPNPGEDDIEIVGTVDDGIREAQWSPDEELLAICTSSSTLVIMSRSFEMLADVQLTSRDIDASNHVSVGWGKVETQFKGKRARALQDPTVPTSVDRGLLSPQDDQRISISWRGDGQYLAINALQDDRRLIRVFSRDGILDSVSEPLDYLEGSLSWRPAGNLIASVRKASDKAEVVFFERNGLRHGKFNLRLSTTDLQSWASSITLQWNTDSTVLAVCFKDRVQLWTMANYHYYLKQTIRLPTTGLGSAQLCWNSERTCLLTAFNNAQLQILHYAFAVSRGSQSPSGDTGSVAVIDGSQLKVTNFRQVNVPPPMSQYEISLDEDIIDVSVNSVARLIATLHPTYVETFRYKANKKGCSRPTSLGKMYLPASCGTPYQLCVTADRELLVLTHKSGSGENIYHAKDDDFNLMQQDSSLARISSIHLCTMAHSVYMQTLRGEVSKVQLSSESVWGKHALSLPDFCPWLEVVKDTESSMAFPVGLSATGSLYARNLVVHGCTSFVLTPAHIIFTTSQHFLKFVHLTDGLSTLAVPGNDPEIDERCRSIERGAKLVTAIPSVHSVVLQMPRGNLETIFPRAMVLAGIRRTIDLRDYRSAFLACRSHRVDMNIIHDHDPVGFMSNVEAFVIQVPEVEHIDLFLSQLREEDVALTLYKDTIKVLDEHGRDTNMTASPTDFVTESKVNKICNEFLRVLQAKRPSHLQNIITAYVCQSPPDLDGGLRIIASLSEHDHSTEDQERAAEHICFLADVNQLYDHALGIYELDVALLIAQQSQKDPREYLPYIQSLQQMTSSRRKFSIDHDLKRFSKALSHLYEMDEFDELKEYTRRQELYSEAVELHKYQPDKLNEMMRMYADYLSQSNQFKEAGIAYEFVGDYAAALPAYKSASMWQEALGCAAIQQLGTEEVKKMAAEIAESLEESRQFQAAATVQLEYLDNVDGCVRLLCKAFQFASAQRIALARKRGDLLETALDPGLMEGFTIMTDMLADCTSQVDAQTGRLRVVRMKKQQEPLAFYAGDATSGQDGDVPDDMSIAATDASTSGGTFLTRYTGRSDGTLNTQTTRRTSKNRRREERKKARGKKGSVYEEEYLINSLTRLMERVNSVGEDISRLGEGLMRRGKREQARVVEMGMSDLVALCDRVQGEVYELEKARAVVSTPPASAEPVDKVVKSRVPPEMIKFRKLSLLGSRSA